MSPDQPSPTILVVEDNDVAREGLAADLRRAGYAVATAADGAQALEALRAGPPPGLILLDMLMPVLDGWHFLGRLRQDGPHPPVVVTTGTAVVGREWAQDHGCAGFLRKPVGAEDLLEEVRRCLGTVVDNAGGAR
jgi:CheY-like chemotaxis protein